MSAFDPELFLQTEVEEANSTEYVPFPEGEHLSSIKDVKIRMIEPKDGGESRPVMDVVFNSQSPEVIEALENPEGGNVRMTCFLDITASGGLDMGKGKNVVLGRLREAIGQNTPGKPWNPLHMVGSPVMINVVHTASNRGDGSVFANVSQVSAA